MLFQSTHVLIFLSHCETSSRFMNVYLPNNLMPHFQSQTKCCLISSTQFQSNSEFYHQIYTTSITWYRSILKIKHSIIQNSSSMTRMVFFFSFRPLLMHVVVRWLSSAQSSKIRNVFHCLVKKYNTAPSTQHITSNIKQHTFSQIIQHKHKHERNHNHPCARPFVHPSTVKHIELHSHVELSCLYTLAFYIPFVKMPTKAIILKRQTR